MSIIHFYLFYYWYQYFARCGINASFDSLISSNVSSVKVENIGYTHIPNCSSTNISFIKKSCVIIYDGLLNAVAFYMVIVWSKSSWSKILTYSPSKTYTCSLSIYVLKIIWNEQWTIYAYINVYICFMHI